MDILKDKIHDNDYTFIELLTTINSKPNESISDHYKLLFSYIHNGSYPEKFYNLVGLFNICDNDEFRIDIAKRIAISIIKNKNKNKYDISLLSQNIIDFMIKNEIFYTFTENKFKYSLFTKIFQNHENTNKTSFNITNENILFFQKRNIGLEIRLRRFIEAQYFPYKYTLNDLELYKNYITFISDQYKNQDILTQENRLTLFSTIKKLYLCVINSLYNAYISNLETIMLFSNIILDQNNSELTNIYNINKITKESQLLKVSLDHLTKTELFNRIMDTDIIIPYNEYDLKNIDSNIINFITYFTHNSKNESYTKIVDRIYNMIVDNRLNIHYKVKLINDSSSVIFKDANHQKTLINIFIDIEKYDENSGFYEKLKTRSTIINILYKFFNKDIYLSIDDKTRYKFITLFISELNEVLSTIQKYLDSCKSVSSLSIQYIPYISTSSKYINELCDYYNLISSIFNIPEFKNSLIDKLCEINYTIVNTLFTSRLYNEIDNTKGAEISIDFISDTLNNKLKTFFEEFYTNLVEFLDDTMVEYICKNENMYDRSILMKTSDIFGYYHIKSERISSSVSNIIKKYCDIIDKAILDNQANVTKYLNDIPIEFLDPIMSTPICDPVELPSSKTIVEKSVIENHLVFSESDPFNRDILTLDLLNKHNSLDRTISNINTFKEKFNLWKKENVI